MKLNQGQAEAVNHDGHAVVVAPPGSGKTRVLVERTKRLIKEAPGIIRLVTFTRNAAQEMKARIGPEAQKIVTAATFDAYCLKMANTGKFKIRPASSIQAWVARQKVIDKLGLQMDTDEVEELLATASTLLDPEQAPSKLATEAYEVYRKTLYDQDVYDFASIARGVVNEIRKKDGQIKVLPTAHLLVDEFQDADEMQLAWVLAHAESGAQVLVVGDDDQAIYSWRGGLGYHAMKAVEDTLDAKRIMVDTCYRSRPEIAEHARLLIAHNRERFQKVVRTPRPCGGKVAWWQMPNEQDAAEAVERHLKSNHWPNFAVLARRNRDLDIYEEVLTATGKRIHRLGGKSLWSKPGAQAVLQIANAIRDVNDHKALATVMTWMRIPQDLQKHVSHAVDSGTPLDDTRLNEQMSTEGRFVEMINRAREMGQSGYDASEVATEIENFIADNESRQWTTHKAAMAASRVLKRRCITQPEKALEKVVSDLVSRAIRQKDIQDADGVLTTMHAAKGMEWPVVYIAAVNEGVVPGDRAEGDAALIEEERRVFYVALTRAEDEAYLISYDKVGGKISAPSSFIEAAQVSPEVADELEAQGA